MSAKRYTLTRTRDDGKVHTITGLALRDAPKHVAWCMDYNAHQSRGEASRVVGLLTVDVPLSAYGYTFVLSLDDAA